MDEPNITAPGTLSPQVVICEEWLKSVGFKWSQFDRQNEKHWILWLGHCLDCGLQKQLFGCDSEELGIEVAPVGHDEQWFCWLRSDTAGRYHRFIHVRHVIAQSDLIALVVALTGLRWNPENHVYGTVRCDACAAVIRRDQARIDRKRLEVSYPWTEHEKDGSRCRPLIDHVDAAVEGGLAK